MKYHDCSQGDTYDLRSPESIEFYGKKMIGKTFRKIYEDAANSKILQMTNAVRETGYDYAEAHSKTNFKGGMGNLIEECYFGYKANSDSMADFPEAGVELKVTSYKKTTRGFSAKERLVLSMINYMDIVKETDFDHSHVWQKARLMLLVWYLHITGQNDIESTIDYVQLFEPPEEDLEIIKEDYQKILAKIRAGKAHELSEGDTMYLGACTKAATSKDRRLQPYSDEQAKPRAFSFKNSYMTYVLTHYIMTGMQTYEPIIGENKKINDFEGYVTKKIAFYQGLSVDEICKNFKITSRSKDLTSLLAFRMLGIKGNRAEEFEKAGVVVKAIRVRHNGTIKESMSFPAFKFSELVNEDWENSIFGTYLKETRFFFIIYKEDSQKILRLRGGQFWNMPEKDIEGDVQNVWRETRDIIKNSRIKLWIDKRGLIHNNFPNKKNHEIAHVRPHGQKRTDTYPLPDGTSLNVHNENQSFVWEDNTRYTKQCFWLNSQYILSQLKEEFLI